MAITMLDDGLGELVDLNVEPECIATGFVFTEGPLWHPVERELTFSDVFGNVMYRWSEAGGTRVFRRPSQGANGNIWDRQGCLITCEHLGRRVSRTNPNGSLDVVALAYEGKLLNSPNDVICVGDGDIIFTDPPYGLLRPDGSFGAQDIPFQGVYRVSASDGSMELLADDFDRPNGLVMTDDGRRLYVADTSRHHVRAFDLDEGGGIAGGEVFVELVHEGSRGRPDGMKLDERGNLYVTANTQEGVWVYSPRGKAARAYPPAGDGREPGLGGRGLADVVCHGDELAIPASHEGRGPAVLASGLMEYLQFGVVVDEQQVRPASLGSLDSDGCRGAQPTISNAGTKPNPGPSVLTAPASPRSSHRDYAIRLMADVAAMVIVQRRSV